MLPSVFQIAITAAKPDDLALVAFWGTQTGLLVPTFLAVGIAVALVQNGHDAVHDIERQFGKALELLTRDRLGCREATVIRSRRRGGACRSDPDSRGSL